MVEVHRQDGFDSVEVQAMLNYVVKVQVYVVHIGMVCLQVPKYDFETIQLRIVPKVAKSFQGPKLMSELER